MPYSTYPERLKRIKEMKTLLKRGVARCLDCQHIQSIENFIKHHGQYFYCKPCYKIRRSRYRNHLKSCAQCHQVKRIYTRYLCGECFTGNAI